MEMDLTSSSLSVDFLLADRRAALKAEIVESGLASFTILMLRRSAVPWKGPPTSSNMRAISNSALLPSKGWASAEFSIQSAAGEVGNNYN